MVAPVEVKEKKVKKVYEGPACSVCGKPLTDPESVRLGIGPLCRAKGWTKEKVAAKMATLKRDVIPAGWIKLSDVAKKLRSEDIPVARMVRAVGGDRGMEDPINATFQVIYVGRARYLSPDTLNGASLTLLRDKYLGKPQPEKKVKEKKEKVAKAPKADKPAEEPKKPAEKGTFLGFGKQ